MKMLLTFLLAASLNAAGQFEGSVTYKVTNPKGKTHTLIYSLKGEKTRLDMATPKQGNIGVIVDNNSKETLVLIEGKKTALKRPLQEARGGSGAKSSLTKTGKSATIAGYLCDEYTAKGESSDAQVWVTSGLGTFRHFEGGPMGSRNKIPLWEKEFAERGLFPLKLTDKGTTLEAAKVEKKTLEDSIFQAPANYKITEK